MPSVEAEDDNSRGKMPPIKVQFEIPYFTVSGIQVRRTPPIRMEFGVRGPILHGLGDLV